MDPELYEIVAGVPFMPVAATLDGAKVCKVLGQDFPILCDSDGDTASGVIVNVDENAKARLDFYELGFGYGIEERQAVSNGISKPVSVYLPAPDSWTPDGPWSLEEWQDQTGPLSRLAAREYINLIGTHTPNQAAHAFPQIRSRVSSYLSAQFLPTPAPFTPDLTAKILPPTRTERPYTDYFSVQEDWISFPTFDGRQSPTVKRASFLSGDAVTILPYDPILDAVLMVRQFRHGPYVRGDRNPWTLEPAAGRIDPGEKPEETAVRELREETGLDANRLHLVGRYYPSPGAYSEYLFSYVAVTDLDGRDGGVAGLAEEAEDIMAHVVPFDKAMKLIETGAANTSPLLISLAWIALNKNKLKNSSL